MRSCGEDPGFFCHRVLDWTGSAPAAEVARWAFAVPARILLIDAEILGLKGDSYRLRDKDLGSPPPRD